ncbi:uncharacterized protein LOC125854782 [Solanum stenotomum]|uniref:uncharacterized protein LOC125854782 n=1 Tax=Solanum stenotomum TaxID=172797 RepID=UPI0020CFF29B|nr:uncharacterized protein LOC125854782 [Solanum stenotomum]
MTTVYARCSVIERLELWENLENVIEDNHLPWVVGGDFNVIRNEEVKFGGLPVSNLETIDFEQCLSSCALEEIKFNGSKYTWWNGRIGETCIFKRLDIIMGNQKFFELLPALEETHLLRQGSDHAPLLVKCNTNSEPMIKPFKFLNFWTKHKDFKKIVEDNWKIDFVGSSFTEVQTKMKKVKAALTEWSKNEYGNIFHEIATLEDIIQTKEAQLEVRLDENSREKLKKAEAKLIRFLNLEEKFWKQKSGLRWFKDGDRNTKFFHSYVKDRKRRMNIKEIHTDQRDIISGTQNIVKEAVKVFKGQFNEVRGDRDYSMLENIPSLITQEDNDSISKPPTENAVKIVVNALNGNNTSGPDSFSRLLFQTCWDILGKDITRMVQTFFAGQELLRFFKSTRGLKQGDPLSPTLFIIAAEVLARGLNKLHKDLDYRGYGIPKWSPNINHLSYADDTILFCSGHHRSIKKMMKVLREYEYVSGQLINLSKSFIYLHEKVPIADCSRIRKLTGIGQGSFPFTYLGCPIFYGRRRSDHFEELLKKVRKRILLWQNKLLSFGERYISVAHVLQSMPVYLLTAMNPPKGIIKQLHMIFAKFYWSNIAGTRSKHWVA